MHREKQTIKTLSIHYHVHDDTEIRNKKAFMSHVKTKAELTKYLSDKLLRYYQGKSQKVIVMHNTVMEVNCSLSDVVSMPEMTSGQHHFEEGAQLVILNAFDVMHRNPQSILCFLSRYRHFYFWVRSRPSASKVNYSSEDEERDNILS